MPNGKSHLLFGAELHAIERTTETFFVLPRLRGRLRTLLSSSLFLLSNEFS